MLKASSDHLTEVQEGYFEHLRAALGYSGLLAKAAIGCALHAIVPGLCTRTASSCIARISSDLSARGVRSERDYRPIVGTSLSGS
jgi:hypothetical protein